MLLSDNLSINENDHLVIGKSDAVALAKEYGIKQAPTLMVISDGYREAITNLSNIKGFIERYKAEN